MRRPSKGWITLALKILKDFHAKALLTAQAVAASALLPPLTTRTAATYDKETKENAIEKTTKNQDVKYKTKGAAGLEKKAAELTTDIEGVTSELDAVNEYLASLDEKCTYTVGSYAVRKARLEAEVNGLKDALDILAKASNFCKSPLLSLGIRRLMQLSPTRALARTSPRVLSSS